MQQVSRRHHYVPIFYLNRWTGSDGRLVAVRKIRDKIVRDRRAPEHTGFEIDLYSYDSNFIEADRDEIETKVLGPLDNDGARVITKIINSEVLTDDEKELWARYIVALRMRSPRMVASAVGSGRKRFAETMDELLPVYKLHRTDGDPETPEEWVEMNRPGFAESFGKRALARFISRPERIAEVLKLSWMALDLQKSETALLTSDHPCIYTTGIRDPNCIVALPLSPRYAFVAYREPRIADRILQTPAREVAQKLNTSVVIQLSRAPIATTGLRQTPSLKSACPRLKLCQRRGKNGGRDRD